MTLDQANPTECCPRRERSNTPLQALTLLNHGLFVQSAEGLARRMNEDAQASNRDKIKRGYLWTVGRLPVPEESQCLERLIAEELHLASLKTTASSPLRPFRKKDDLAWTIVAQMLLNTDEFLTRE